MAKKAIIANKQMSKKELFAYAFGLFGFQIIVGYLTSYQASFFNKIMGAEFAIVGTILLVCKLISAVFDPAIGNLIDRTKSKIGKLKPFMWYSIPALIIFTIIIFSPFKSLKTASDPVLYFYIFITYFLWCIAMTLGDIPSQAMSAVITTNNLERDGAITLSSTFKTVGLVMPAVIMPVVCWCVPGGNTPFSANAGGFNEMEYLMSAIACVVIGCGCFALIPIFNKERVVYHAEKNSLKEMGRAIKNNKYLMLIFFSYIFGFGRMGAVPIPTQTAGALLGDEGQSAIVGLSTAIGGMISMIVSPMLVKKFDERKTFIGMSAYHFVLSAICIAVSFTIGYDGWKIYIAYVLLFFRGLGCGAYYILPMLMIADAVDYYEFKTGKRTEGISYSVNSFAIKITMAMVTAVSLAFVGRSGYVSGMLLKDISRETQNWVYFAFAGFPGICYLLSCIPIFKYDLVGKKKQEMIEGLKVMRATAALATPDGVSIDASDLIPTSSDAPIESDDISK